MSYRSIKRVLGESNLERKCRLFFGSSLFLLIMGSFLWYGEETKTNRLSAEFEDGSAARAYHSNAALERS